jgi:hypothetical protein
MDRFILVAREIKVLSESRWARGTHGTTLEINFQRLWKICGSILCESVSVCTMHCT